MSLKDRKLVKGVPYGKEIREKERNFEIVFPDDPEYKEQVRLLSKVQMPPPRLFYDLFARDYNRLGVGGTMDWPVPMFMSRANTIRCLQGRGLDYKQGHFSFSVIKESKDYHRVRGLRMYKVVKHKDVMCRTVLPAEQLEQEVRTVDNVAATMALLKWQRERAAKGHAIYRLPDDIPDEAEFGSRVVVLQISKHSDDLRRKLPLLDVGVAPGMPKEKARDKEFFQEIARTSPKEKLKPRKEPEGVRPPAADFDGVEFG